MKINIIACGTKPPAWIQQGYQEYIQRLSNEFTINLIEVSISKRTRGADLNRLIKCEGECMLNTIHSSDWVVALTEQGQLWNNQQLAMQLQTWRERGSNLCLLIGGPDGLSQEVLARAQQHWSLSPLTFPHLLVRILLVEQLYRAFSILNRHPYHR